MLRRPWRGRAAVAVSGIVLHAAGLHYMLRFDTVGLPPIPGTSDSVVIYPLFESHRPGRTSPKRADSHQVRTMDSGQRPAMKRRLDRVVTAESDVATPEMPARTVPGTPEAAPIPGPSIATLLSAARDADRELRRSGEAQAVEFGSSTMEKLGKAIAAAHIDRSTYARRGRMESGDGIVYYSYTRGGRTECIMSGGSKGPVPIACPEGAGAWAAY